MRALGPHERSQCCAPIRSPQWMTAAAPSAPGFAHGAGERLGPVVAVRDDADVHLIMVSDKRDATEGLMDELDSSVSEPRQISDEL